MNYFGQQAAIARKLPREVSMLVDLEATGKKNLF